MSRIRARLETLRGDDGLTLVEMVVVTVILGVVLAMVQMTTITAQKDVSGNASRLDQLQQSKVAMEAMSKTLRTSVLPTQLNGTCSACDDSAFITGDVRTVSFYANINNDSNVTGPSQVSYNVDASGNLTEAIHGPNPHAANDYNYQYSCTAGTPGCVVISRVIARKVDTAQVMFTYYDASGAAIAPPLTATTLPLVDSIDVVLKVKSSKLTPATTLTTRVTLPNADAVAQATST